MIIDYAFWFSGSYSKHKINKFIRQYYYYIAELMYIDELTHQVPSLIFTNAKTYYGQIIRQGNDYPKIMLSHWHILNPFWDYDDFLIEITDTICHELAHMIFWKHGEEHTELTNALKNYVSISLSLYKLELKCNKV